PGYYRDLILVSESEGSQQAIALTVHVKAPQRDIAVSVVNDQGQPVANATLELLKQEPSVVVTQGVVETVPVRVQGRTDAQGMVQFPALDLGSYSYVLAAEKHTSAIGSLVVTEGTMRQQETLTLPAQAALRLAPESPVLGIAQGETRSLSIQISNLGAAPLTNVVITPPGALPWVYLGTPGVIPAIAPGQSIEFTVFASPADALPLGSYQEYLTVAADGGQSRQVALTLNVTSHAARDVQLKVTDLDGAPLDAGRVVLIDQALTTNTIAGKDYLLHQQHNATVDSSGTVTLNALAPGSYNYLIAADGYYQGAGELLVTPGEAPESLAVALRPDPFTYEWEVKPINDVQYAITLNMTYDVKSKPELIIEPRDWDFDPCNPDVLYDTLTVHNPSIIPVELTGFTLAVPGVAVEVGAYPTTLDAEQSMTVPVTATLTGEPGEGRSLIDFNYQRVRDEKQVSFTFTRSAVQGQLHPHQEYIEQYLIEPGTFEAGVRYRTSVYQPLNLTWLTLTLDTIGSIVWTEQTAIPITLTATTPDFVTEGRYTDRATLVVRGDDGSEREGYVDFVVTKTDSGLYLESSFTLGPIPYTEQEATSSGGIYADKGECNAGNSASGGDWSWSEHPSGGKFIGTYEGNASPRPPFPSTPPLVQKEEHQQVRLELQQRALLEGEDFLARLSMKNITNQDIERVTVYLRVKDNTGKWSSDKFTILPDVAAGLGTIPVGESGSAEWLLLPNNLDLSAPEDFTVQAVIAYDWQGSSYRLETLPEAITVHPSPDLKLTYRLPLPEDTCEIFNLNLIVTNQGQGAARNLRLNSVQPQIIQNDANVKLGFNITETYINQVPQANALDLNLG
ncbi:MAG: hypothetical protein H0T73_23780, partial [Ardenticatenales bacterium]|nr:hypothetical protein [Ardenticatenales bacterium]